MARYLYSELASLLQARRNCEAKTDSTWYMRHTDTIDSLVKEFLPSGSGFDNGTSLDFDASHADKLVLHTAFHHMDESGGYDGWTNHTVTVTPSLSHAFNLRISGRNRNDIKELIHQEFETALHSDCEFRLYQFTYDIQLTLSPAIETTDNCVGCPAIWNGRAKLLTTGREFLICQFGTRAECERKLLEYVKANRQTVARHASEVTA